MKLVDPAINFEFIFRIWNFICERTRWKPDRYSIFAAAATNFLRANRSIIIINMKNTIDPITAQPRENYTPLQTRNSRADIIRTDSNVDGTARTIDRRATFSRRLGAHREVDDAARDPQITARRIRQLLGRSRAGVECKGDTLTCGVIDFERKRESGGNLSSRRRSISRNTATRSVKIPISLLLSVRERVRLPSPSDSRRRYRTGPAGDVCISRDFRASANGQCIYKHGTWPSLAPRPRFRTWERAGKGRPDLEDRTRGSLPIRGSTMRARGE